MKSGSFVSFLVLLLIVITGITIWSNSSQGQGGEEEISEMDLFTRGENPPEVRLLGPISNGSGGPDPIPRYKDWPHLEWENHDPDPEDLEPGATKYTLYIGTDRSLVENMSPEMRSPRFVNMSNSETTVTVDDTYPDLENITYWGILAIDTSGTENFTSGGAYRYDYEAPNYPVNLTISPVRYYDETRRITYIDIGETITIRVTAPSSIDDPDMDRIVFQARYNNALEREWFDIGTDDNTSDNMYETTWKVEEVMYWPPIINFRAHAYDDLNNSQESIIHSTGDYFYFVESITDLSLKNVNLSTNKTISGRNITIQVTVHNGGEVVDEAYNVICSIWVRYWHGANEHLGLLDFGYISPWVDYYPDDTELGEGDKQKEFIWRTPRLPYGGRENYTIFVTVGTDFYGLEYTVPVNSSNNEGTANLTVTGTPTGPPVLYISELTGDDFREGYASFSILCKSNVIIDFVEYWLKDGDQWNRAERDDDLEFDPEVWESAWIVHINTSTLEDGEHIVLFRADNGKYLSDSVFVTFVVDAREDEEQDFFLLELIIMILILLFSLLIIIVYSPDEYLPSFMRDHPTPSTNQKNESPALPADKKKKAAVSPDDETSPEGSKCTECGNIIGTQKDSLPIRLTCQDCGHENVRDEFRK